MRTTLRFVPAFLWAGLIYFLSSRHHVPGWLAATHGADKVAHAGIYAVLCGWLLFGVNSHRIKIIWCCVIVASLYGISDEYHQGFVAGRTKDAWDWLADTFGAAMCALVYQHVGLRFLRRSVARTADRLPPNF